MYSIHSYSTNIYGVPLCASHVLGSADSAVNKTDKNPCFHWAYSQVCGEEEETKKQLMKPTCIIHDNHHKKALKEVSELLRGSALQKEKEAQGL